MTTYYGNTSNENLAYSSSGLAYSSAFSDDTVDQYAMSLIFPGSVVTTYPDGNADPRMTKQILYNATLTGSTNYMVVFNPHSSNAVTVYTSATDGAYSLPTIVSPSQSLSTDFAKYRSTTGYLNCTSATIASGAMNVQGQIYGVITADAPNYTTLASNQLISYSQTNVDVLANVVLADGITLLAPPNRDLTWIDPRTFNTYGKEFVFASNAQYDTSGVRLAPTLSGSTTNPGRSSGWDATSSQAASTANVLYDSSLDAGPGVNGSFLPNGGIGRMKLKFRIAGIAITTGAAIITATITVESATQTLYSEPAIGNTTIVGQIPMTIELETTLNFVAPVDQITITVNTPATSAFIPESCTLSLTAYETAIPGRVNAPSILVITGVSAAQTIALQGAVNYEVIPGFDLSKNMKLDRGSSNPRDAWLANMLYLNRAQLGLRGVYRTSEYAKLCEQASSNSALFSRVNLAKVASTGFFGDLWSGVKKIGKIVSPALVNHFVPPEIRPAVNFGLQRIGFAADQELDLPQDSAPASTSSYDTPRIAYTSDKEIDLTSLKEVAVTPALDEEASYRFTEAYECPEKCHNGCEACAEHEFLSHSDGKRVAVIENAFSDRPSAFQDKKYSVEEWEEYDDVLESMLEAKRPPPEFSPDQFGRALQDMVEMLYAPYQYTDDTIDRRAMYDSIIQFTALLDPALMALARRQLTRIANAAVAHRGIIEKNRDTEETSLPLTLYAYDSYAITPYMALLTTIVISDSQVPRDDDLADIEGLFLSNLDLYRGDVVAHTSAEEKKSKYELLRFRPLPDGKGYTIWIKAEKGRVARYATRDLEAFCKMFDDDVTRQLLEKAKNTAFTSDSSKMMSDLLAQMAKVMAMMPERERTMVASKMQSIASGSSGKIRNVNPGFFPGNGAEMNAAQQMESTRKIIAREMIGGGPPVISQKGVSPFTFAIAMVPAVLMSKAVESKEFEVAILHYVITDRPLKTLMYTDNPVTYSRIDGADGFSINLSDQFDSSHRAFVTRLNWAEYADKYLTCFENIPHITGRSSEGAFWALSNGIPPNFAISSTMTMVNGAWEMGPVANVREKMSAIKAYKVPIVFGDAQKIRFNMSDDAYKQILSGDPVAYKCNDPQDLVAMSLAMGSHRTTIEGARAIQSRNEPGELSAGSRERLLQRMEESKAPQQFIDQARLITNEKRLMNLQNNFEQWLKGGTNKAGGSSSPSNAAIAAAKYVLGMANVPSNFGGSAGRARLEGIVNGQVTSNTFLDALETFHARQMRVEGNSAIAQKNKGLADAKKKTKAPVNRSLFDLEL